MVREAKKEEMGMVYREFSRQKYNKYKLQFPKMRQSEIITKIIKEWEALNDEAKLTLKRTFQQNKFLSTDDISNSETKRTDSKQAKAKAAEEATEPKPTEIHAGQKLRVIYEKSDKKDEEESGVNRDSDQQNESQVDSDSSQKKTKKIEKGRGESANDYIKHFKFYYEKFRKEHPKWNSAQISSIIKLLWRKRNLSLRLAKRTKQTRIKKDRPIKLLSGWLFFKNRLLKEKGCTLLEAKFLWKRLPREVKLMQTNLAKEMAGQPSRVKAFKQKICLALQPMIEDSNRETTLSFMKAKIAN